MASQSFADAVRALCLAHQRELSELRAAHERPDLQEPASRDDAQAPSPRQPALAGAVAAAGLVVLGLEANRGESCFSNESQEQLIHASRTFTVTEDRVLQNWADIVDRRIRWRGTSVRGEKALRFDVQPFWATVVQFHRNPSHIPQDSTTSWASRTADRLCADVSVERTRTVEEMQRAGLKTWLTRPDCLWRIAWAAVGIASVTWDVITLPLQVFPLGNFVSTLNTLSAITLVYWVLDALLQFSLGYYTVDGRFESRVSVISKRYLRTWFFPDLLVILLEFSVLISLQVLGDGGHDVFGTVRLSKSLRMLRVVRLLRWRHLREAMRGLFNRIGSDRVLLVLELMKYVLLMLVINHYVACMWYATISVVDADSMTWIVDLDPTSTAQAYFMALHWSLTQFSPATQNISPTNEVERMFACMVSCMAVVAFSSLVSNITNAVNKLSMVHIDFFVERQALREFMVARKVSRGLFCKILSFFNRNYEFNKRRMLEKDVPFIMQLPESFRAQMHVEMYTPLLREYFPFKTFCKVDQGAFLKRMSHEAMLDEVRTAGHCLFQKKAQAKGMLYIMRGDVEYEVMQKRGRQSQRNADRILHHKWLAEASFWLQWRHAGDLVVASPTDAVMLNVAAIEKIVMSASFGPLMRDCFRTTALFFCKMSEDACDGGGRLTDLPCDAALLDDIVERAWKFGSSRCPSGHALNENMSAIESLARRRLWTGLNRGPVDVLAAAHRASQRVSVSFWRQEQQEDGRVPDTEAERCGLESPDLRIQVSSGPSLTI